MFKISRKTIAMTIFAVLLFGCGREADEAKKLGFASVDEMKEAHTKGWHTKEKFEEDADAKRKGYASGTEMKKAIAKKKEDEEKLRLAEEEKEKERSKYAEAQRRKQEEQMQAEILRKKNMKYTILFVCMDIYKNGMDQQLGDLLLSDYSDEGMGRTVYVQRMRTSPVNQYCKSAVNRLNNQQVIDALQSPKYSANGSDYYLFKEGGSTFGIMGWTQ
jgi:flagellar biosynthesis GTPase FlhF